MGNLVHKPSGFFSETSTRLYNTWPRARICGRPFDSNPDFLEFEARNFMDLEVKAP